ncbi:MAG: fatty acid desaturase [Acidiferrobacterales bacterium]|nr:fatty acid desaturase [Acidiferrobacterales bacterium]
MKIRKKIDEFQIEWPTIGLLIVSYAMWLVCLMGFTAFPVLSVIGMSLTLALHSSITHELIHGHPTRSDRINMALGLIPLTMFYPIHLFKETHLKHHNDENLTIPGVDPESFFCCPQKWQGKCRVARAYAWINMTLTGRMLLSLPNTLVQVSRFFARDLVKGNQTQRSLWLLHFSLLSLLCSAIVVLDKMPLEWYLLCTWVAHLIIAFRAFFEHRPARHPEHRIVVVKSNWFFRLMYLGNNYHALHHQCPRLPWYQIPKAFEVNQLDILRKNDHFYFSGYFSWLTYLFRPIHSPVHPGAPDRGSS